MNTQEKPLFGSVEPEVVERIGAATGDALRKNRRLAVIGSVPILLAAASAEAFADGLPQQVVDVLNYALTLEHFEDSFYRKANGTDGLIPAKYRDLFREIGQHETGHVALLSGVLGSAAVKPPKFDFTAGGKYPDVFYSDNLRAVEIPDASGNQIVVPWWYRTQFTLAKGAHGAVDVVRRRGCASTM